MPAVTTWYASWLKTIRVVGNLILVTADEQTPGKCGTLNIPAAHKAAGVAASDVIVYVTTESDPATSTIAWATTCALDASDINRPIAG